MAKKETPRTTLDELNEGLSSIEQKVEENKKRIYYVAAGILVLAVLIFGYIYGFRNPNMEKAKNAIAKADMTLLQGNDSLALVQYQEVVENFSNATANRAALNAAIILYQKEKYQEAADYLKKFSPKGTLVAPASQSLLGDCLVNLDKLDEAISAYDKAVKLSDDNKLYTPLFLMKKANVLRELGKYAEEAECYKTIKEKYPEFSLNYNIDVEKYYERAAAQ